MNPIRLSEPFEAMGYIFFPFADPAKHIYLGRLSYNPNSGSLIRLVFQHFLRDNIKFLYEQDQVVIGGVFNTNLFLFSSLCKVLNKEQIGFIHEINPTWMKSIDFEADYVYLEDFDYQLKQDGYTNSPDEIYSNQDNPPGISEYLICFNEVHEICKKQSFYFDELELYRILKQTNLDLEASRKEILQASKNEIRCNLTNFDLTIRNRIHKQAKSIKYDGLCVNLINSNSNLKILETIRMAEKIRYLFILLLRYPINIKYIECFKKDRRLPISILHKFKEIIHDPLTPMGFNLDNLSQNEDLSQALETWLFKTDDSIFEEYIKPTLFERYDRRYDFNLKIMLLLARIEGIYSNVYGSKSKLYDILLRIFCMMENDKIYDKIISNQAPKEIVKKIIVDVRNNIAHEARTGLSEPIDFQRFYNLIFLIFEYFTLKVILELSTERLMELCCNCENLDFFLFEKRIL